ncbi:PH domain-containing protein [Staphylococcus coagulans]|uniref:PH domain-containing protein n=1 Tax=Staphylococcus coagulans TaxID=74706 RepID=A0A9X0PG61_9STAP|nr:PH domain-containing protein [Staphylococcus coagulans]MBA8772626.1 PH domain-containing protein [Staphylococcus coagulans]MBA8777150.1 PH domain-containing protein [Staphylococcus coagulans]
MEKMSGQGPKAMRVVAVIVAAIILIVLIASLVAAFYLEWNKWMLVLSGLIAVIWLLYLIIYAWINPIYQYRIFGYHYTKDLITVREGFIFIRQDTIPLFRIQNVDLNEGWIMRKYHLATLILSTAGGNHQVSYIDKQVALKIMKFIKRESQNDLEFPQNATSNQMNDGDEEIS